MLANCLSRHKLEVTYANSCCRVLGKQDSLEFDDEEVDELLDVVQECLQGLFWHSIVFARTERGRDTGSHYKLANYLSKRSD
jgi:hypothetical protein